MANAAHRFGNGFIHNPGAFFIGIVVYGTVSIDTIMAYGTNFKAIITFLA